MTPPGLPSRWSFVYFVLCFASVLVTLARASPLLNEPRSTPLPILKLPYASYQASSYNAVEDIYTFKNIRYAAPPVGDLRWNKPVPPLVNTTLQDGSYGPSCIQASMKGLNIVGSGNKSPVGAAVNQFMSGIPVPLFDTGDEDCLFLDLYVPGKALRAALSSSSTSKLPKLPVIVWIYGGGYLMGSKDALQPELPFYDGSPLIHASHGGLIFVAPNYRLGAYGFLAGTTMERDGLPNAGLWDQRAALQWVQDHISLVGGDPDQVTAMGESAGAGSLMHHLTAAGGTLAPLFRRAILQSPAYQWMWDRAGHLENTFQAFATLAGCGGTSAQAKTNASSTLACLRAADAATLVAANAALMDTVPEGSFAVGPAADGTYVRQLPVLELATGNHVVAGAANGHGTVEALVLSHCSDEGTLFVSGTLGTDAAFSGFLEAIFPNYTASAPGGDGTTSINEQILAFYPPVAQKDSPYETESARVEAFIRDSCFTCHVRHITEAVGDARVWNMQYAVTPGWHGTDLVPTFFDTSPGSLADMDSWLESLVALFVPVAGLLVRALAIGMQGYFASFAMTGDPNTARMSSWLAPTIAWNHPDSSSEQIAGVLNVGDDGFSTVRDAQVGKTACDFWHSVAAAVTSQGGYAPPGAVVDQDLVVVTNDPSANYVGGNGVI